MHFSDLNDDERLRRYLLGTMDEEQAGELECRLLADGELFELAEAVEGDLLAEAVRGTLSAAERGHLLRRLTASPGGRARVALARALAAVNGDPLAAKVVALHFLERPAIRAAALAASLLFAAGVFQLVTTTALPGAGHGTNTITHGLPAVPEIRREAAPLLLQLALTGVRSAGRDVPCLVIPAGAPRDAILALPLDPGETSTSFTAVLRDAGTGAEILARQGITAKDVHGRRTIVLSVSSVKLRPGSIYEIEVRGTGPRGDDLLGRPMFNVASSPP